MEETPTPWTVALRRGSISGNWYYSATMNGSEVTVSGPTLGASSAENAAIEARAAIDRVVAGRREIPAPFQYTPAA